MNATAAALESLDLYKGAGTGPSEPAIKLDVVEALQRTAPDFFEALGKQREARLAEVLGGCDPLAAVLGDLDATAAAGVAFSLRGRTVVVTGASRGIGEAIAVRWGAATDSSWLTKTCLWCPGSTQDQLFALSIFEPAAARSLQLGARLAAQT